MSPRDSAVDHVLAEAADELDVETESPRPKRMATSAEMKAFFGGAIRYTPTLESDGSPEGSQSSQKGPVSGEDAAGADTDAPPVPEPSEG